MSIKAHMALLALLPMLAVAPAARAEAPLSRADVQKIVAEYIAAHPEEILTSLQQYQENAERMKGAEAVKKNGDDLFNDAATPMAGNPKGDVTVVEFFDYNCGYCKKMIPVVVNLLEGDKNVRVLFKEYPILGPSSEMASKWAFAANKQGKYFEFHKRLMTNAKPINETLLNDIAKTIGMDVVKAKADAYGTEALMHIERNRALASGMGIHGTPAFIVGGEMSPGAISEDDMRDLVKKARDAATKN